MAVEGDGTWAAGAAQTSYHTEGVSVYRAKGNHLFEAAYSLVVQRGIKGADVEPFESAQTRGGIN